MGLQLFCGLFSVMDFLSVFRRVSPCVRFVEERRVSTRLRSLAQCRQFLSTSHFFAAWATKALLRIKDRAVFSALFRRVSPCVRFVTESRVSTRLRIFARCRRFLSASQFLRRLVKEYTFLANGFQDFFFNRLPLIINNKRSVLNTFQHKQIIVKTLLPKG